jgi:hypothetical protein
MHVPHACPLGVDFCLKCELNDNKVKFTHQKRCGIAARGGHKQAGSLGWCSPAPRARVLCHPAMVPTLMVLLPLRHGQQTEYVFSEQRYGLALVAR